MTLFKCPECEKEISDKATTCPHCGFPLKELSTSSSTNPPEQKMQKAKKSPNRITKNSHEQFEFVANEKSGVKIKCVNCGNVFSIQKALFKEVDDTGATPVSEISCPICSQSQPSKTAKVKEEKSAQETMQEIGCCALLLFPVLFLCALIGTFVDSSTASASPIPPFLGMASLLCFIGDFFFIG